MPDYLLSYSFLNRRPLHHAFLPCRIGVDHALVDLEDGVSWFNVLIKMKNIFRIVASLDLYQTIIVRSVSRSEPVALFFGHEIYVSAGRGVRRTGVKKSARPFDAAHILRRAVPSSVHIQDELGVPVRVSHRVGRHTIGRAGDMADENLALGRGQLAGVLDDRIQRAVVELGEVMRFPVVSSSGREQGIEGFLPLSIRLRANVLAQDVAEGSQALDQLLAFRDG